MAKIPDTSVHVYRVSSMNRFSLSIGYTIDSLFKALYADISFMAVPINIITVYSIKTAMKEIILAYGALNKLSVAIAYSNTCSY